MVNYIFAADEKKVEKVAKKASKSKSGSINKRSDRDSTSSGNVDKKDSTDVGKDVSVGVSADVSKDVSIKELERLLALKEESLKSAATTCNNLSTTSKNLSTISRDLSFPRHTEYFGFLRIFNFCAESRNFRFLRGIVETSFLHGKSQKTANFHCLPR